MVLGIRNSETVPYPCFYVDCPLGIQFATPFPWCDPLVDPGLPSVSWEILPRNTCPVSVCPGLPVCWWFFSCPLGISRSTWIRFRKFWGQRKIVSHTRRTVAVFVGVCFLCRCTLLSSHPVSSLPAPGTSPTPGERRISGSPPRLSRLFEGEGLRTPFLSLFVFPSLSAVRVAGRGPFSPSLSLERTGNALRAGPSIKAVRLPVGKSFWHRQPFKQHAL